MTMHLREGQVSDKTEPVCYLWVYIGFPFTNIHAVRRDKMLSSSCFQQSKVEELAARVLFTNGKPMYR